MKQIVNFVFYEQLGLFRCLYKILRCESAFGIAEHLLHQRTGLHGST